MVQVFGVPDWRVRASQSFPEALDFCRADGLGVENFAIERVREETRGRFL